MIIECNGWTFTPWKSSLEKKERKNHRTLKIMMLNFESEEALKKKIKGWKHVHHLLMLHAEIWTLLHVFSIYLSTYSTHKGYAICVKFKHLFHCCQLNYFNWYNLTAKEDFFILEFACTICFCMIVHKLVSTYVLCGDMVTEGSSFYAINCYDKSSGSFTVAFDPYRTSEVHLQWSKKET